MTTVNFSHNLQSGSPTLNGTAGSLIGVLDAALVSGFGLQTATITVASGVATLTTPLAHPFEVAQIVLVAGADNTALNGRKRVLTRTTTGITFAAAGVADGAATGSINVKVAPAGWAKEFSGTNKAVYRAPASADGCRLYLRVDDTFGRNARVVGYESMTDVDTGEWPFPTSTQLSGGGWWPKSNSADSNARAWTVIADDRGFYLHMGTGNAAGDSGSVWGFGDFYSYKSGDAYAGMLASVGNDQSGSGGAEGSALELVSISHYLRCARSFTGLAGAIVLRKTPEFFRNGNEVSGNGYGIVTTYPNGPNNGLILSRIALSEDGICLRGNTRGAYITPQNCHASFMRNTVIDGAGDMAGRKLLAVKCGSPAGTSSQGVMFFDVTGPW